MVNFILETDRSCFYVTFHRRAVGRDERLILWLRNGDFIVDEMRAVREDLVKQPRGAIHQVHITKHGRTRVDSLSRFLY
jgi:hypothetical protein